MKFLKLFVVTSSLLWATSNCFATPTCTDDKNYLWEKAISSIMPGYRFSAAGFCTGVQLSAYYDSDGVKHCVSSCNMICGFFDRRPISCQWKPGEWDQAVCYYPNLKNCHPLQ